MTVVQPNSIAGINSISVQSGQSLSIHKSDGTLIREIVASTGISTYSSISVGSATTTNNAAKSINIGLGASIAQHADNTLSFGTNGDERLRIDSGGRIGIGIVPAVGEGAELSIKSSDGQTNVGLIPNTNSESSQLTFYNATNDSAQGYIKYDNSSNSLQFRVNLAERLRIDSSGRLLTGHTAAYGSGKSQVFNTAQYLLDLSTWSADANGPTVDFYKSRNATVGSATVVQSGDVVGRLRFLGNDGANSRTAAQITAEVDGTPGTNDMPGRLVFSTVPDGSTTVTERLRINQAGRVLIGHNASINSYGVESRLQVSGTDYPNSSIAIRRDADSAGGGAVIFSKSRGSQGGVTVVQSGDSLGELVFCGADGTDVTSYAGTINCSVDGTPGSNDMPGRLTFHTAADGAAGVTERMRITSSGFVGIGEDTPLCKLDVDGGARFQSANTDKHQDGCIIERNSGDGACLLYTSPSPRDS